MEKKLTLEEFIVKWYGKTVDTDKIWPNECMDLMHQYCIDCLGITDPTVLSALAAKTVYENFANIGGSSLFEKIDNTPTFIPQKGDIFFFGKDVGENGHVCIFFEGDINTFRSFDANWEIKTPHIQEHNYRGALGVLRYKWPPVETPPDYKAMYEEKKALETELRGVIEKKDIELTKYKDYEAIKVELKEYKDGLDVANKEIDKLKEQLKNAPVAPVVPPPPSTPVPVVINDPQVAEIDKNVSYLVRFVEAIKKFFSMTLEW